MVHVAIVSCVTSFLVPLLHAVWAKAIAQSSAKFTDLPIRVAVVEIAASIASVTAVLCAKRCVKLIFVNML